MIVLDDFKKLDIRIGTIISAERVPDTDKLIKFVFNLGSEKRQIIAGMLPFFPDPQVLVGKQMPILTNIEPRTFQGETSHGMILAADVDNKPILLHPETAIPAGAIVR